ncbi:MAG: hypothetical protein M3162_05250 [Thermoproteota archaeon]|nr:hypothetical protein [Thermoproteota archaeon]
MDIDSKWKHTGGQGYYSEEGILDRRIVGSKTKTVTLYRWPLGHIFGRTTKM